MSSGAHTLELATFIVDGSLLESSRSAPLLVNRTGPSNAAPPEPPVTWPSGMTVSTSDGFGLRIDRIADGLINPTDMAFAPDGRVFVAEQSGRVRVLMPDGAMLVQPALTLRRSPSDRTQLVALGRGSALRRDTFRLHDFHGDDASHWPARLYSVAVSRNHEHAGRPHRPARRRSRVGRRRLRLACAQAQTARCSSRSTMEATRSRLAIWRRPTEKFFGSILTARPRTIRPA